ncbi:MAG: serine protease [Dehalococcoidia bacterium]|nr:serine protease [Dehalococcoidia bacterium]
MRATRTAPAALATLLLLAVLFTACDRASTFIRRDQVTPTPLDASATPTPIVAPPILPPSGVGVPGADQRARADALPLAQLSAPVVQLQLLETAAGQPAPVRVGSAVVVDRAQRLLLTSYALVDPYRADGTRAYATIAVAVAATAGAAPEPRFEAEIVSADPTLDLAVLRAVRTYRGGALDPGAFTISAATLGNADAIKRGDAIRLLGYSVPDPARPSAVSSTTAVVTGFRGNARVSGRAWIKTDARLPAAIGGGPAFDVTGALIGIVTQLRYDARAVVGELRPLTLASDLIERARRAGAEARYVAPLQHSPLLPGTAGGTPTDGIVIGQPAFAQNAVVDEGQLGLFDYTRLFSQPPPAIYYEYALQAVPNGTLVEERWYLQDVLQDGFSSSYNWNGGSFGLVADHLTAPNPRGMPLGVWRLEVRIGGAVRAGAAAIVGAPPSTEPRMSGFSFASAAAPAGGQPVPASGSARQLLAFFDYRDAGGTSQMRWIVFRNGRVEYQSPVVPWSGGDSGRWWVGYSPDDPVGAGFWEFEIYFDSPGQPKPVSRGANGVQLF